MCAKRDDEPLMAREGAAERRHVEGDDCPLSYRSAMLVDARQNLANDRPIAKVSSSAAAFSHSVSMARHAGLRPYDCSLHGARGSPGAPDGDE